MNGPEAYNEVCAILRNAGFYQSSVLFTSTEVPEAVKDRSFRVLPVGPISFHVQGVGVDTQLLFNALIAFSVPPEDEIALVSNAIMPALDRIIDSLVMLGTFDPTVPVQAAVELDDDARFLVLSITAAVTYQRSRSVA